MKSQKVTTERQAASKRRYDDACGTAHALDLVGERWALLVLRELMLGPKRFSDLRADLPGISANVLTQRLEGLEASGLLVRRKLPPPASTQVYELTQWGYEAEPIVQSLGRWAARSPAHDPTLPISSTSIILSFRTMFDGERAKGMRASLGLRLGREAFRGSMADGRLEIARGDPEGADFIFTGTAAALAAAVYGKQPLDALAEAGALTLEGDRALAEQFLTLFPLPPKVE
ncbi:winged helix-turn-helix transcriptional regulator [Sphingosinicella humi]|uniref:Transcriptional regulator n=1 Tax=Allosphingosinicella humi TaxID=2068657 RepID=A0A2U2J0C4_9SPHN|nr:winged helix-turn-helix transcriptional regulator [Sphingosinicella humi]PWG01790.1 transcriptional regulator [Sphingosinicella humi]